MCADETPIVEAEEHVSSEQATTTRSLACLGMKFALVNRSLARLCSCFLLRWLAPPGSRNPELRKRRPMTVDSSTRRRVREGPVGTVKRALGIATVLPEYTPRASCAAETLVAIARKCGRNPMLEAVRGESQFSGSCIHIYIGHPRIPKHHTYLCGSCVEKATFRALTQPPHNEANR